MFAIFKDQNPHFEASFLFLRIFVLLLLYFFLPSVIFVSPELSSGRDLVIQMSVRRATSAVRRPWFFVRNISREPYDLP